MVIRTGSRRYPQTNYKTSNYCIAYLDILGATQKICNDENFDFLNHLNMFMEDAISESGNGVFKRQEEMRIKIFSDNILITLKLNPKDPERDYKIAVLFTTVANIYNEILRYGYLMRGAIVEGEFFQNDIIVYGKALVEAVKLEEGAGNPRIIVKAQVSKNYQYHYLMQDDDEELFLNIFQLCEPFDDIAFKSNLLEMLKKHKDNEKIKAKIMWMINYFNSWFTKYEYRQLNQQQIINTEIKEALQ